MVIGDRDLSDSADEFRCYRASDGEPLWTISYPAPGNLDYGNTPRATPLIHGEWAFLQGAFGDLRCAKLATGEVLWLKNYAIDFGSTADLAWGFCPAPLLVDGKLIVNPGATSASLAALDPASGKVIWLAPGDLPAYGSFIAAKLGGVLQVIGHNRESLNGWEAATGKQLWELKPTEPDDFNVPTPIAYRGKLIVASENNGTRLYAFDEQGAINPSPAMVNEELAPDISTPVVVGKKLYGLWGDLYCLDLKEGLKTDWTASDSSFRIYGSLIACRDRLLIAGASGEILLLDAAAKRYRLLSRLAVFDNNDAELYSHPAIVGSRLYLRGEDQLVCLELDTASSD